MVAGASKYAPESSPPPPATSVASAGAAVEGVVAWPTAQVVVAVAAHKRVVSAVPEERVVAGVPGERVAEVAPVQLLGAGERVVALPGRGARGEARGDGSGLVE